MKFKKSIAWIFVGLSLIAWQCFAADYYVLVDGQQQGPIEIEQLQQLKNDGAVTHDSLVWKAGMATWVKAGEQPDLQNIFAKNVAFPPPLPVAAPPAVPGLSPPSGESTDQNDVNELNAMADPKSVPTASESMDAWFDTVLETFNIGSFGENNGKFTFEASQSVSLKPIDPQYGDALVNAFDKAMMSLQEKYLQARFGRISVDKIRSFYSDRSTNANEIVLPPIEDPGYLGKALLVLDKGLDVTAKKLDEQLLKMGIAPEELSRMTPTQKKDVFRDKFVKNTLKEASGSIAGLFPIQTNVITDKNGNTVVGVVAVASPKSIQIVKDINLQRKSVATGKGRDLRTLLPNNEAEYMGTLGVRLTYDQDGSPAIISYGISAYRPDMGDDYMNDELKAEAKADAISNADAQIAEIVNGVMSSKSERQRGEEVRKYVEREMKPGTDSIEKSIKNIIKITSNEARSSAQARLQGISTIKTWRYTAPTGQKFEGAVRAWKYSTLQAVNSFNQPKKTSAQQPKAEKSSFQPLQQTSKPVNSMDDF